MGELRTEEQALTLSFLAALKAQRRFNILSYFMSMQTET